MERNQERASVSHIAFCWASVVSALISGIRPSKHTEETPHFYSVYRLLQCLIHQFYLSSFYLIFYRHILERTLHILLTFSFPFLPYFSCNLSFFYSFSPHLYFPYSFLPFQTSNCPPLPAQRNESLPFCITLF